MSEPIESTPNASQSVPAPAKANHFLLPPNVGAVAACAAKGGIRFATESIHVQRREGGRYRIESTNGRVLARVEGKEVIDDYPEIPALVTAPNGASEALLPVKEFKRSCTIAAKMEKPLAVVLGPQQATLASTDGSTTNVYKLNIVEGRYPDTDSVLPTDPPDVSVVIDPTLLMQLLEVARQFTTYENAHLILDFWKVKDGFTTSPVRVKNAGQNGQEFIGLVVPMSRQ